MERSRAVGGRERERGGTFFKCLRFHVLQPCSCSAGGDAAAVTDYPSTWKERPYAAYHERSPIPPRRNFLQAGPVHMLSCFVHPSHWASEETIVRGGSKIFENKRCPEKC